MLLSEYLEVTRLAIVTWLSKPRWIFCNDKFLMLMLARFSLRFHLIMVPGFWKFLCFTFILHPFLFSVYIQLGSVSLHLLSWRWRDHFLCQLAWNASSALLTFCLKLSSDRCIMPRAKFLMMLSREQQKLLWSMNVEYKEHLVFQSVLLLQPQFLWLSPLQSPAVNLWQWRG